jgi:hypothetical protein
MRSRRIHLLLYLFSPLVTLVGIQCAWADEVGNAAIAVRLDLLKNFSADYTLWTYHDPDPKFASEFVNPMVANGGTYLAGKRTELSKETFSYLEGRAKWDKWLDDVTIQEMLQHGLPVVWHQVEAYSPGREDQLIEQKLLNRSNYVNGGISNFDSLPDDWTIDLALGIRLPGETSFLLRNQLDSAKEVASADPKLFVLQIDGEKGLTHVLSFDKQKLYALTSVRTTYSDGSFIEVENTNLRQLGNVYLPYKIVRTTEYTDSSGKRRHPFIRTVSVDRYSLPDPTNTVEKFLVSWPANMVIRDNRVNERITVGPLSRVLTDDDIATAIHQEKDQQERLEQRAKERLNRIESNSTSSGKPTTEP